jgi:lantibiotic modifying enzyme
MSAVLDIADALRPFSTENKADASLAGGSAGLAVFFAALGEISGDDRDNDTALRFLDVAAGAVARQDFFDPGLYTGPVGVAWAFSALEGRLLAPDREDSDLDLLLEHVLRPSPWPGQFDLVGGLVGLGTYCLERLPRRTARRGCELVVSRLAEAAVTMPGGLAWLSHGAVGTPSLLEAHPEGYVDLGLAHGVAGVIAFLAHSAAAEVAGATSLLEPAVSWLRGQRLQEKSESVYPGIVPLTGDPDPARLAWCYGDLGIASALLAASAALSDGQLRAEALHLMRGAAGREASTGVVDAGLCHGASGIAQVLTRAGQETTDTILLEHARRWLRETLELRDLAEGLGGFAAFRPATGGSSHTSHEALPGLLEGAAGVGLVLLSAVAPNEPWWDAPLLIHPVRSKE